MKPLLYALLGLPLLFSGRLYAQAPPVHFVNTLMPQPQSLTVSDGWLPVTSAWTVSLNGSENALLKSATNRMLTRLESMTGVELSRDLQQPAQALVSIEIKDSSLTMPALGIDESYTLDIRAGKVQLQAANVFGAMHGFETLLQLVQASGDGFSLPFVHIQDAPRFPWRGLLLDPGRHFLPVDVILRNLDGMAAVKMNVLHWHLTEDQGFRVESQRFPKLQQLGSNGLYYTQDQIREVVKYATERGIRVVPEFDMPGHSTSWFVGYSDLASAPGPYHVEYQNKIYDPAMDPTRESTYRFLDSFIDEMTTLFPDDYIHIGGDESNGKQWKENPSIQHFMQQHNLKDTAALQAYFNARVQELLKKHHRQMVGWDEILQADLSPDVVVQNWHGIEFLINSARQGHHGLLSKPFYLDHMYSAAEMYAADPVPADAGLTDAQAKLVLGGEACMWGEQVTGLIVDSRIWPRTAAVAERFWSPANTRDTQDMYRRLQVESLRLDALHLTHLSGPERGLRQIAGSEEGAESLSVLASVLQPVDFHERYAEQHTSQRTPIGHLVDFVHPDPPMKEALAAMVETYLHSTDPAEHKNALAALESLFQSWVSSRPALDQLAVDHPFIAEMQQRREQLPRLGLLGLESLGYIEAKQHPSAAWLDQQKQLLSDAGKHVELTDFVVLDPLNALLDNISATK
ncbi:beta-N-acetylhexosaminidase [Silvibacterium dinghuense]|uniref:Beta-N-acetylhexosaminidase n=1 Tax=Silvibacterium dinghuense TaxID=1560006 RepID=A0A4Q1SBS5_9BACT|nr:family 20 glycosylhydrolase [Silvibacterium dinghuense]RXS94280.1 beta-N-acetylhexosaminidase [Silvibacterium dinghuense]